MSYEVWGEPDGGHCSFCEQAQEDYASMEKVTDNLAMMAAQLIRALRKADPGNALAERSLEYLKKENLLGSPLRKDD